MSPRSVIILLCTVLVITQTHGRAKNEKKQKLGGGKDKVEEIEDRLKKLENGESCPASKVVFHFHGDEHVHGEDDVNPDDQHVHVHVHTDGHHGGDSHGDPHEHKAVCDIYDPDGSQMDGKIKFNQMSNAYHSSVEFNFQQFGPPERGDVKFTAHVHVSGDLSDGCDAVGPHYNPYDEDVDVGVLGDISVASGNIVQAPETTHLTLFGDTSIIGRSVVIHNPDSSPLGCCVIGWSRDDYTGDHAHAHLHDFSHDDHSHSGVGGHHHHHH
ncbi:Superoxide dismutase [Cu-Zn] [Mactra antiquata]